MSDLQIFIPILKVDEERRLVYGVATAEEKDKSGEICDYATTKPNYEAWMGEFQKATDGQSSGCLRVMHDRKIAAGAIRKIDFDDPGKKILICAEVVDDQEWRKVLKGVYTGFSQGGSYSRRWKDSGDDGAWRYTARPSEISLVDTPCLSSARFEVIKTDGSTELHKFEHTLEDDLLPALTKSQEDEEETFLAATISMLKSLDSSLSDRDAAAIVAAEVLNRWESLRKYDASEPRDERGRWTTGSGSTEAGSRAGRAVGGTTGEIVGGHFGAHFGAVLGQAVGGNHGEAIGESLGEHAGEVAGRVAGEAAGAISGSAAYRAAESVTEQAINSASAASQHAVLATRHLVSALSYVGDQAYVRGRNVLHGAAAGAIHGVSTDKPWIGLAAFRGAAGGVAAGAVAGPAGMAIGAVLGAAGAAGLEAARQAAWSGAAGAAAGASLGVVDDKKLNSRVRTAVDVSNIARSVVGVSRYVLRTPLGAKVAGSARQAYHNVRYPGFQGKYTGGGGYRSTYEHGSSGRDVMRMAERLSPSLTEMQKIGMSAQDIVGLAEWLTHEEVTVKNMSKITAEAIAERAVALAKTAGDETKWIPQIEKAMSELVTEADCVDESDNAGDQTGDGTDDDSTGDDNTDPTKKKDGEDCPEKSVDTADLAKTILERAEALGKTEETVVVETPVQKLTKALTVEKWDETNSSVVIKWMSDIVLAELSKAEGAKPDELKKFFEDLHTYISSQAQESADDAQKMAGRLDELFKAGDVSPASLAQIQSIHDVCLRLGCNCQGEKQETSGDLAKISTERDTLRETLEKLSPQLDKITERMSAQEAELKKLRAQPAPRPGLRIVEKGHDVVLERGGEVDTALSSQFEKLTPDQKQEFLVKVSQSKPLPFGGSR